MNDQRPAVTSGFYVGLANGILLSIPLWVLIYGLVKWIMSL